MKFNCTKIVKIPFELKDYLLSLENASRDEQYLSYESVLHLPQDKNLLKQVYDIVKQKKFSNLKEVFVIGIGGSNLGSLAVCSALRPTEIKLCFLDTVNGVVLKQARERIKQIYINKGSVLINIISKSGETSETIINSSILIDELKNNDNNWRSKIVVTTEPNSKLYDWAKENKISFLPNYKNIGGRFSVFSPVGLFPMAIAGVNIKKLLYGASKMISICVKNNQKNPAILSSTILFDSIKNGAVINNLFLFNEYLFQLGKWNTQIMAESLGKNKKGILPITTVGTTDLHSMYQLFLGGPKNIFTTFVNVKKTVNEKISSIDKNFDAIVPSLNKKSTNQFLSVIYESVKTTYKNNGLEFCEIEFEKICEEEIGSFLQFKMIETMLLARLLGINAFDQPNVEEYKKIARKNL